MPGSQGKWRASVIGTKGPFSPVPTSQLPAGLHSLACLPTRQGLQPSPHKSQTWKDPAHPECWAEGGGEAQGQQGCSRDPHFALRELGTLGIITPPHLPPLVCRVGREPQNMEEPWEACPRLRGAPAESPPHGIGRVVGTRGPFVLPVLTTASHTVLAPGGTPGCLPRLVYVVCPNLGLHAPPGLPPPQGPLSQAMAPHSPTAHTGRLGAPPNPKLSSDPVPGPYHDIPAHPGSDSVSLTRMSLHRCQGHAANKGWVTSRS